MEMRKVGAPALELNVVNRLLDLLTTDDAFRAIFERDTPAALEFAGYVHVADHVVHPGMCLHTPHLASKEAIASQRAKLTTTLHAIVNFDAPRELKA
jgi:putative modified peptide